MTLPLIQVYAYRDIGATSSAGGGGGGAFNHLSVQTVVSTAASGSFPTKTAAAPTIWDNCSGSAVTDLWSGAWPDSSGAPYDNTYSTSFRSTPFPHTHTTRYMRGAAYPGFSNATNGFNVMAWKSRTINSFPARTYLHFFQRADPAWSGNGSVNPFDGNFKITDFSADAQPYAAAANWYLATFFDATSGFEQRIINDDDSAYDNPDRSGNNFFFGGGTGMGTNVINWVKNEVEILHDTTNNGYVNWYLDGVLTSKSPATGHSYYGHTAGSAYTAPGTFSDAVGGYIRDQGFTSNFVYNCDIALDYEFTRLMLTNNASYTTGTIFEYQPASIWTSSSITFTVNLGKFTNGQTAYLWVIGSSGATGSPAPALASTYTCGT